MRMVFFAATALLVASRVLAQVDVESRRTLTVQTSEAVVHSEELLRPFGYFWFNQNDYPWTNTALRVIFAGVYADAELSWFLPANTNVAVGAGTGGGFYLDSITPYRQGERISSEQFYGDDGGGRVFINETILNPTPLPLNVRATYAVSGSFYRRADTTRDFTLPDDFFTQTLMAELRFGGIEPGLTARRGAEFYLGADANYRSGFEAFGPNGNLLPAHSEYQRVYGSLAGKIPAERTTVYARVGGGFGDRLDELSAYKIGGNLVNVGPFTSTLHGYYTREFLADDFVLANLAVSQQLTDAHKVSAHLYGDWAALKQVPPGPDEWHNFFGVGGGLSFRAFWQTDWLLTYGYGINAIRNGDRGGHEIGVAMEKKF